MCHIHKRDFDTLMLQALCYASIKVLDSSQLMFSAFTSAVPLQKAPTAILLVLGVWR